MDSAFDLGGDGIRELPAEWNSGQAPARGRNASRAENWSVLKGAALGRAPRKASWGLGLFRGRLGEISGASATAVLTTAFGLVREAQVSGEVVAWISERGCTFFPPDCAASGIDLERLVVILLPVRDWGPAADLLVRSRGFGLVILDLAGASLLAVGGGDPIERRVPLGIQSRLAALAKKHETAVIFLTEKAPERPSFGPLVSLRIATSRREEKARRDGGPAELHIEARILKDKGSGLRLEFGELCHGPPGWKL